MSRWAVVVVLAVFPAVALACPVCFDPKETTRSAFLGSTAFLSLLPLLMMGGVGWFIRSKVRAAKQAARLATVHAIEPTRPVAT